MNDFLIELFRAHGVEAIHDGEKLAFPRQFMQASAAVVRDQVQGNVHSVQLDVRIEFGLGRTIVESFGGFGTTRETAIADAQGNFVLNSFHVIHAAFFSPNDTQVDREQWLIGGESKQIALGNIGIRGKLSEPSTVAPEWFQRFATRLRTKKVRAGTHWVRFYYAQVDRHVLACEVLLDNDPWQELQTEMAAEGWPLGEGFFGLRVFLIIQDGLDVSQAAATIWQLRDSDEEAIRKALVSRGVPRAEAEKFVAYVPLAFGRVLLHGVGVRFADTVVLQHPDTNASVQVRLEDERIFVEALRLAEEAYTQGTLGRDQFSTLAFRSAEVNTVNQALNGGSRPEDLVCSAPIVFCSAIGPETA